MHVLLVGHALGPGRGSEYGGTWHWAWWLSQHVTVTVLAHPRFQDEVTSFLARHPNPNLRVIWVRLPRAVDPWRRPDRGERGIRLHYPLWLHQAFRTAQRLSFDLLHYVSWGTLAVTMPFHALGRPVVWGPCGGGQRVPLAFWPYLGWAGVREWQRGLRVELLPWFPGWRRAVHKARLILATNQETLALARRAGGQDVRLFLDSGVPLEWCEPPVPRSPGRPFRLLWAGRLEARKALPLALDALAQIPDGWELWVAGQGSMQAAWQARAARLGPRVRFLGQVPWMQMPACFRAADAFLFTSLQDSFGSVVLEALAHGLPVIALDHQGVGTFVPDTAAIKVPVTSPAETVAGLAAAIRRLMAEPDTWQAMRRQAWQFAQTERWDRRASRMVALYREILHAPHAEPLHAK